MKYRHRGFLSLYLRLWLVVGLLVGVKGLLACRQTATSLLAATSSADSKVIFTMPYQADASPMHRTYTGDLTRCAAMRGSACAAWFVWLVPFGSQPGLSESLPPPTRDCALELILVP